MGNQQYGIEGLRLLIMPFKLKKYLIWEFKLPLLLEEAISSGVLSGVSKGFDQFRSDQMGTGNRY